MYWRDSYEGVRGRNEGAEEDRNSTRRPKISTNLDYWGHRETETSTKQHPKAGQRAPGT